MTLELLLSLATFGLAFALTILLVAHRYRLWIITAGGMLSAAVAFVVLLTFEHQPLQNSNVASFSDGVGQVGNSVWTWFLGLLRGATGAVLVAIAYMLGVLAGGFWTRRKGRDL